MPYPLLVPVDRRPAFIRFASTAVRATPRSSSAILRRVFGLCRMAGLLGCLGLPAHGAVPPSEPMLLNPPGPPLAGTEALTMTGDIASNLVAGADRFLDRKLEQAQARRDRFGGRNVASIEEYEAGWKEDRERLAKMLGVVERRTVMGGLEWISSPTQPALVATSAVVRVEAIRWPAFGEVNGEGLVLLPVGRDAVADVIAIPDADLTPEQWIGLEPGTAAVSGVPLRLAASGCRVLVPFLINRNAGEPKVSWDEKRGRNLHNREYLHRAAFEMGRTLAGYEVLKVLALVDALRRETAERAIGVFGWGEGGRLALYAAALDPRLKAAGVSGYFGPRDRVWEEPLDHNVFGLLERFGDAELAGMVAPRALVVEAARGPERVFPSDGGAPGRLITPEAALARAEFERARYLSRGLTPAPRLEWIESDGGKGTAGSAPALTVFLEALKEGTRLAEDPAPLRDLRRWSDPRGRADRQRNELDRHTQALLIDSASVRDRFMKGLDVSSPEKFQETQTAYRDYFDRTVIGKFDDALLPARPRSRLAYEDTRWRGYEVVLDVFPEVFAYGLLLVPKDLREGERRPVVVCQHGLEGRPQSTIGKDGFEAYSAFSARLADRGFIVFAPQNLYIFRDRFRVLQRKANPLGRTLFSIITPQHQQIVNWLKTQAFVDPSRIAFYGLSYGGKTAMRVPALVTDYCLSICSADFNEWVWKNTSTRSPYSYMWSGEYEIFEWDLGHTFNYAEMASLIAPRPFMVERGHFDGVAPDETVAFEFAKVRHFYAARLRRPADDCRIEWFVGPHQIHGVGTYEFLHQQLKWPVPSGL
ncbi:MAG: dienelactone hydrolase family protein [Verrucomicrobiales bacterium]|nr:dienelactone hydrolase family protein [Verrucomicrobiales bacterium]